MGFGVKRPGLNPDNCLPLGMFLYLSKPQCSQDKDTHQYKCRPPLHSAWHTASAQEILANILLLKLAILSLTGYNVQNTSFLFSSSMGYIITNKQFMCVLF